MFYILPDEDFFSQVPQCAVTFFFKAWVWFHLFLCVYKDIIWCHVALCFFEVGARKSLNNIYKMSQNLTV